MSKLSRKAEAALIRDAEAARDDSRTVRRRVKATTPETVVLSVRLPAARARRVRDIAEREEISLSELLDKAIDALVSSAPPRLSAGVSMTRMYVYSGLGPGGADTDEGLATELTASGSLMPATV